MDCKNAEKALLRSFDEKLDEKTEDLLKRHIQSCAACRKREREYREIVGLLRKKEAAEPLPYFERRLLAKLKLEEKSFPALVWVRLAHRVVAFSLAVLVIFGAGILLFQPQEPRELSQVETLLLHDENPLQEAANLLEQKKPEDRNMMLIFASLDEKGFSRR